MSECAKVAEKQLGVDQIKMSVGDLAMLQQNRILNVHKPKKYILGQSKMTFKIIALVS